MSFEIMSRSSFYNFRSMHNSKSKRIHPFSGMNFKPVREGTCKRLIVICLLIGSHFHHWIESKQFERH